MTYYRNLKTGSNLIVKALIFIEKSIRDSNNGKNDPTLINKYTFEKANRYLIESHYTQVTQYGIAKELEVIANMLQSGHNSSYIRFHNKGFQLLSKPFSFK